MTSNLIKKLVAGNIEVTLWETINKEGKSYQSISLRKNYFDGKDWRASTVYFADDVPKIITCLQEIYKFTMIKTEIFTSAKKIAEEYVG